MTETPRYTVIRKENNFEIRQYSAYIKAEVDVTQTTYRTAIFKGFSILAGYIFGNNTAAEKIAMTAPVQLSQPQKIAMTKPVTISGEGTYTVAFVMPSEYTLETLPVPTDGAIRFTGIPSHTMAVVRFSGFYQEARVGKAKDRLTEWLKKSNLKPRGDFIVAGYNPPWVPGFLARNEVMIRIASEEVKT